MPAFGQTGLVLATAGFSYKVKNLKRGWTGIWYGESRSNTNTGYYHSTYNNFTNYSDYYNSVNVGRTYNGITWATQWNNDIYGAQLWVNGIFNSLWAYVTGTSTYVVCNSNTWTY